jgi:parvulin-like peptidyl-prolyl isomerase
MALRVNGETIDDAQIQQEVERLRPDYERAFADQSDEEKEKQLLEWSKENLIERVLIREQLRKTKGRVPKETVDTVLTRLKKQNNDDKQLYAQFGVQTDDGLREVITLTFGMDLLVEDIGKTVPEPSKAEMEQYYAENKERFRTKELVRAGHIVKHIVGQTDDKTAYEAIRQAQQQLQKGILFEFVVTQYSDCPESSGDLGYIARGQMVEEFDDVVFNLGAGQTSDIFRTRFGYHIARVYDKKPGVVPGLGEVKEEVVSAIKQHKRDEAFGQYLDRLRSGATIEGI